MKQVNIRRPSVVGKPMNKPTVARNYSKPTKQTIAVAPLSQMTWVAHISLVGSTEVALYCAVDLSERGSDSLVP